VTSDYDVFAISTCIFLSGLAKHSVRPIIIHSCVAKSIGSFLTFFLFFLTTKCIPIYASIVVVVVFVVIASNSHDHREIVMHGSISAAATVCYS